MAAGTRRLFPAEPKWGWGQRRSGCEGPRGRGLSSCSFFPKLAPSIFTPHLQLHQGRGHLWSKSPKFLLAVRLRPRSTSPPLPLPQSLTPKPGLQTDGDSPPPAGLWGCLHGTPVVSSLPAGPRPSPFRHVSLQLHQAEKGVHVPHRLGPEGPHQELLHGRLQGFPLADVPQVLPEGDGFPQGHPARGDPEESAGPSGCLSLSRREDPAQAASLRAALALPLPWAGLGFGSGPDGHPATLDEARSSLGPRLLPRHRQPPSPSQTVDRFPSTRDSSSCSKDNVYVPTQVTGGQPRGLQFKTKFHREPQKYPLVFRSIQDVLPATSSAASSPKASPI